MAATKKKTVTRRARPGGASLQSGVSFSEAIYRALSAEIADGKLAAGERVREAEVAERFHISRTPVREALKRLEAEGAIVDMPRTGLIVAKPSLNEVLDEYRTREVLEGLAARFAAERAWESDVLMLRSLLRRVEEAHQAGDVSKVEQMSEAWDETLFRAARSPRLQRTIEAARAAQGATRRGNLRNEARRAASIKERHEIMEAIAARNGLEADAATRRHLEAAREFVVATFESPS